MRDGGRVRGREGEREGMKDGWRVKKHVIMANSSNSMFLHERDEFTLSQVTRRAGFMFR